MKRVTARSVVIDADKVVIRTLFRSFAVCRAAVAGYRIEKIPSLYDEIGIFLEAGQEFLVTERSKGFFDLAKFLDVEKSFGFLWYREAEDGRRLEK